MMTPQERGAKGGQVKAADSKAKAAALRKLHARMRGKRQSQRSRSRETVLAEVAGLVKPPIYGERSVNIVAKWCRVSPRTVSRWLSGEDWPPITHVRRMQQWVENQHTEQVQQAQH